MFVLSNSYRHAVIAIFVLVLVLALPNVGLASPIRDYYDEPGLNPFSESHADHPNEVIDPFNGILRLAYKDLMLPGDGGFDINVYRFYKHHSEGPDYPGPIHPFGAGWFIHQGRVLMDISADSTICQQLDGNGFDHEVDDNPSFEKPDGSRILFFVDKNNLTRFISRDNWMLECIGDGDYLVRSPDGTKFRANRRSDFINEDFVSWFVTEIEDVHNNKSNISYVNIYGGTLAGAFAISTISSPDGRAVTFEYSDVGTQQVTLDKIIAFKSTAHEQVWDYTYEPLEGHAGSYYHLIEVVRPDGTMWNYTYYPHSMPEGDFGKHSLKTITYPYGGEICYTYDGMPDGGDIVPVNPDHIVLKTKTIDACPDEFLGGAPPRERHWAYSYYRDTATQSLVEDPDEPGRLIPNDPDVTTIVAPEGKYVYRHAGFNTIGGRNWTVGLLLDKTTYDLNDEPVEVVADSWDYRIISDDKYWHGRGLRDEFTGAPVLTRRAIKRLNSSTTGRNYTTEFQNYDIFGNPGKVIETGDTKATSAERFTRVTDFTYFNNTTEWIIGLPETEIITNIGEISRTYEPTTGDLKSKTNYGVTTTYTYYPDGNLESVTDARLNTTTYSDYFRGLARLEQHPEGVTIERDINIDGTIAWEKNGRGFTTSYEYDGLNRITGITFPRAESLPVSVDWNGEVWNGTHYDNGRVLTRGNFRQIKKRDGFGRTVEVISEDTGRDARITRTIGFDYLGRKTFESYPNSTEGVSFEYDVLSRLTRKVFPDGTDAVYDHSWDNSLTVTNQRGISTDFRYRAFGDPDDRALIRVDAPESISTSIERNEIDLVEKIIQGETSGSGFARSYGYDTRYFLTSIDNPETGVTVYGRDEVGNMTSKQVGDAVATIFQYDGLNRLDFIDYPVGTSDVDFVYDGNDNIKSVINGSITRTYQYDENDNLDFETLSIGSTTYNIDYAYDALDNLDTMQYPSGRTIEYSPDAFGRITMASPYADIVDYYPSGSLKKIQYANGQVTDYELDNRRRVKNISTGKTSSVVDLTYGYDGVGNVKTIADAVDASQNRVMTYDGVNRLKTADGSWGSLIFDYDHLGNLDAKTLNGVTTNYGYLNNKLQVVSGAVDRSYSYDVYGNVSEDGSFTYDYDDARNLRTSTVTSGGVPVGTETTWFSYDGNNMRVARTNDGVTSHFVYANNGNLLGEYFTDADETVENFYIGAQRIASVRGNPPPVVDAGGDQVVEEGALVTLDGSGSVSYTGWVEEYQWFQLSGTPVTLSDPNAAVTTFVAPSGDYKDLHYPLEFLLRIRNSNGDTSSTTVVVEVRMRDNDGDTVSDVWEQNYFGDTGSYSAIDDPDNDGLNNIEEYRRGLDPTVPDPLNEPFGIVIRPDNGQNTITWMPDSRATSYDLYWDTSPDVSSASNVVTDVSSPYTHAGLINGQEYFYKLVPKRGCCQTESREYSVVTGKSGWSDASLLAENVLANENMGYDFYGHSEAIDLGATFSGRSLLVASRLTADKIHTEIVAFIYEMETGWGSPTVIDVYENLEYGEPRNINLRVSMSNDGTAVVVWDVESELTSINPDFDPDDYGLRFSSYEPGLEWSTPENLSTYGTSSEISKEPLWFDVGRDGDGNMLVLWARRVENESGDARFQVYSQAYSATTGWQVEDAVYDSVTDSSIMVSGDISTNLYAVVALQVRTSLGWGECRLEFVSRVFEFGSSWNSSTQLSNYTTCAGTDTLVSSINSKGEAAVIYDVEGTDSDQAVVRYDPTTGWSSPLALENAYSRHFFKDMVLSNEGDIALGQWWGDDTPSWNLFSLRVYSRVSNVWYSGLVSEYDFGKSITVDIDVAGDKHFLYDNRSIFRSDSYHRDYGYALKHVKYKKHKGLRLSEALTDAEPNSSVHDRILQAYHSGLVAGAVVDYSWTPRGLISIRYFEVPGAPLADAGISEQDVSKGSYGTLTGADSADDSAIVSYEWRQIAGFPVAITDPTLETTTFYVDPADYDRHDNRLVFELSVRDDEGMVGRDTVIFYANEGARPVASISAPAEVDEGQTITLDGTGSYDEDGTIVDYEWRQYSGPTAVLDTPFQATTNLTAPMVDSDSVIELVFYVTDDVGNRDLEYLSITVNDVDNIGPTADAGPDQVVVEGDSVTLDGTGSYDSDGGIVSYQWRKIAGPTTSIVNSDSAIASFSAPYVEASSILTFELTVTDDLGSIGTDTVDITVQDLSEVDTSPPETEATYDVTRTDYQADYDVTLSSSEPGTTYFRFSGAGSLTGGGSDVQNEWQVYSGTIHFELDVFGYVAFEYYSVDAAGNAEPITWRMLQ